jgi:hypothetical protein
MRLNRGKLDVTVLMIARRKEIVGRLAEKVNKRSLYVTSVGVLG